MLIKTLENFQKLAEKNRTRAINFFNIANSSYRKRAFSYLATLTELTKMPPAKEEDAISLISKQLNVKEKTVAEYIRFLKSKEWILEENGKLVANEEKIQRRLEELNFVVEDEDEAKETQATDQKMANDEELEIFEENPEAKTETFLKFYNALENTLSINFKEKEFKILERSPTTTIFNIFSSIYAKHHQIPLLFIQNPPKDLKNAINEESKDQLIFVEGIITGIVKDQALWNFAVSFECDGTEKDPHPPVSIDKIFFPKTTTPKCPICGKKMELKPNLLKEEVEALVLLLFIPSENKHIPAIIPAFLFNEIKNASFIKAVAVLRYDDLGVFSQNPKYIPYLEILGVEETTSFSTKTKEEIRKELKKRGYENGLDFLMNFIDFKDIYKDENFSDVMKLFISASAAHLTYTYEYTGFNVESVGALLIGTAGTGKSKLANQLALLVSDNVEEGEYLVEPSDSQTNLVAIENQVSNEIKAVVKGILPRNDLGVVVFEEISATLSNREKLAVLKDAITRGIVKRTIRGLTYTFPARITRIGIMNPPAELSDRFKTALENLFSLSTLPAQQDYNDLKNVLLAILEKLDVSNIDRFPLIFIFPKIDKEKINFAKLKPKQIKEKDLLLARELIKAIRYEDISFTPTAEDHFNRFISEKIEPVSSTFNISTQRIASVLKALCKGIAKLKFHNTVQVEDVNDMKRIVLYSYLFRFSESFYRDIEESYLISKREKELLEALKGAYEILKVTYDEVLEEDLIEEIATSTGFDKKLIRRFVAEQKRYGILREVKPGIVVLGGGVGVY